MNTYSGLYAKNLLIEGITRETGRQTIKIRNGCKKQDLFSKGRSHGMQAWVAGVSG